METNLRARTLSETRGFVKALSSVKMCQGSITSALPTIQESAHQKTTSAFSGTDSQELSDRRRDRAITTCNLLDFNGTDGS
jgi:hypothetical protein